MRQRYSQSGSSMLRSIQRSLYRLWRSQRLSIHIWKSFSVCFSLLESMTSANLPSTNTPYTHFISCGHTRIPFPSYCPPQNSPTQRFPLLKYFSPKVESQELWQQPRSMVLRYRLLWPDASAFSAYILAASPCTSPRSLQYPMVSQLWSYLTCMLRGRQKVSSNACSCFTPMVRVIAFRLKTSSLLRWSSCNTFSKIAPSWKTISNILLVQQLMRQPQPLARWLFPEKGILTMNLPILYAISQSILLRNRMEVIESSLKIILWPLGASWQYSLTTVAPSSCRINPLPCFCDDSMPPMQTALLQWQKNR